MMHSQIMLQVPLFLTESTVRAVPKSLSHTIVWPVICHDNTVCWQRTATSCLSENTPYGQPWVWRGRGLKPKYERSFQCTCASADAVKQCSSLIDVAQCPHSDRKSSCLLCDCFVCACVCVSMCDRERNWPSASWLYLLCWAQRFTVTPPSSVSSSE